MTLSLWLSQYPLGIIVVSTCAVGMFTLGWLVSWLGRERYIDKRISDAVAREHNELRIRCEVAEARAKAYGIGLRAAGATMCDMADLSDHEVKIVIVRDEEAK